jgi:hypothetical protein
MDILNEDLLELLKSFDAFDVKYMIVGGFATNYYGFNRVTGDIDFWIKDSFENRKSIMESFESIGYGRFEELLSIPLIPGYCDIYISEGLYADLMNKILGFDSLDFDTCFQNANATSINGINVFFLNYKDLLHSKKNSIRLKDKLDFQELSRINAEE